MEVQRGRFHLMNSTRNTSRGCCMESMWDGPALRNRWFTLMLRVKFSPDREVGFVEMHGDLGDGMRLLMPKTYTHTMKQDGRGRAIDSHSRIGIYRNPRIQGTAEIYFDGYAVATTAAAAQQAALSDVATAGTRIGRQHSRSANAARARAARAWAARARP
jgi:hypothetical protein